jgi:hypothetical protein
MATPHSSSSQLRLIQQQTQLEPDFVYENPVAFIADDTLRLSSVVPFPVITSGHHTSSTPGLRQLETSQDETRYRQDTETPLADSPLFATLSSRLPDRPPSYSDHWQPPLRQASIIR